MDRGVTPFAAADWRGHNGRFFTRRRSSSAGRWHGHRGTGPAGPRGRADGGRAARNAVREEGEPTVTQPRLTFICELDRARLTALFAANKTITGDLQALKARIALALSDFSDERAAVVQQLNGAGIRAVAIPLLPLTDGYYFTADNAAKAAQRFEEWTHWTKRHGLVWDGVGLDLEPDIRIFQQAQDNPGRLVPVLARRLFDRRRAHQPREEYTALVDRIRSEGWKVENYQFPVIADERRARSTLLQRLALVDVATDREVWMLYSSFMRRLGPGMIWSYGPPATAIGVGSTGGGPDIPGAPQVPTLSWEEFARDLRLASHWCDDVYVYSLEGCVWQGFLTRLRSFDWAEPVKRPRQAWMARGLRATLTAALWTTAHPLPVLGVSAASAWLLAHRRGRPEPRA